MTIIPARGYTADPFGPYQQEQAHSVCLRRHDCPSWDLVTITALPHRQRVLKETLYAPSYVLFREYIYIYTSSSVTAPRSQQSSSHPSQSLSHFQLSTYSKQIQDKRENDGLDSTQWRRKRQRQRLNSYK